MKRYAIKKRYKEGARGSRHHHSLAVIVSTGIVLQHNGRHDRTYEDVKRGRSGIYIDQQRKSSCGKDGGVGSCMEELETIHAKRCNSCHGVRRSLSIGSPSSRHLLLCNPVAT